jgi:hypothetical protein
LTENAATGQKGRPKPNSCEISGLIIGGNGEKMRARGGGIPEILGRIGIIPD